MSLPKILVTGFANSGTSFMCELVVAMGFSAGSPCNLKGADGHNRYGYWEHMPLRNAVWGRAGNFDPARIPKQPVNAGRWPGAQSIILDIADQDKVEVYKDCTGPWTYPLLLGVEKVVLMRRDARTLYERYYSDRWEWPEFNAAHTAYYDLAAKFMDGVLPVLVAPYEAYEHGPKMALFTLCEFLERPYDTSLLSVYRPRRNR